MGSIGGEYGRMSLKRCIMVRYRLKYTEKGSLLERRGSNWVMGHLCFCMHGVEKFHATIPTMQREKYRFR